MPIDADICLKGDCVEMGMQFVMLLSGMVRC